MWGKWTKRMGALFLSLLLLLPLSSPVYGQSGGDTARTEENTLISSPSGVLMEAQTGTVIFEKDKDTRRRPASITKIMTALLTIENCSLDETVTFSYRATHELEENSSGIARRRSDGLSTMRR